MRRTIAALLAAAAATWASLALAQDSVPPPLTSETPAPTIPTTQITTTAPPAPPATSTTTTTQAAVETSPMPPAPPIRESVRSETTSYVNGPLLLTGLFLFSASYVPAIGIAAESSRPSDRPNLYIPVAGPWIDLGQRGCTPQRPCNDESGNKALLIVDGVTQGVGALAMVTSLFIPEKKSRHWIFIGNENAHLTPTMVGGGYGMAAVGKF